jgi:hypothetical protein
MDLYEALRKSESGRAIMARLEEEARLRDGVSRQAEWHAEDGWIIIYTTSRIKGGPHDGKFLTQAFKPVGKGARAGRGKAQEWEQAYRRQFSTRKAAAKRADELYRQHSPKWDAAHPKR